METANWVLIEECCAHLDVEFTFINSLNECGIIEIVVYEDEKYISNEHLKELEKAIRFHYELNVNIEGIDVINNLLKQIDELKEELRSTKNKLDLLEL